jgi:acetyltransferase-like isoleucine patch superfamily enzyme
MSADSTSAAANETPGAQPLAARTSEPLGESHSSKNVLPAPQVIGRGGIDWKRALRAAIRRPGRAIAVARTLVRGQAYRIKFRILRRNVIIGKRFRVTGRLDIQGPGTVIFGDDCFVVSSYIQPTTPWTHSADAVIRFGNGVGLAGTRLGCRVRIEVGDNTGLSDARILDSDFHNARAHTENRQNSDGASKPVIIGRNVWLGAGAMILKGVRIGDNAVVGAGSVVATNVPPDTVVFGNPAKVIWNNKASGDSVTKPNA